MIKRKTFVILISAVLLVLLVGLCVLLALRANRDKAPDINDTLPDGGGKRATVIILAGQSNAAGCSRDEYLKKNVSAEKYAEYEGGYDNVYINYYVSDTSASNGFVKCSVRQGEIGECFGPELGLAEKLHEASPDENFFIIKWTWSGTNLFEQWRAPSSKGKTGEMYKKFEIFVETSVKYLERKNYDVSVAGMCWMQGESDAFSVETASDYRENLVSFIKDVRKKLGRYASDGGIAFVDAYIADNPSLWTHCDIVNEKKREVSELSDINFIIDTSSLVCTEEPESEPDMAHYDSMSEIKLGHLFAEQIIKFIG